MLFFRSFLFVGLISILAALGLLALGSVMGYEEFRGGYAVLTVDDSIDDRTLRSYLEKGANIFGGSPVSESLQWVMLDEFDAVRAIPLDSYFSRVSSFDPRNDGYAEKLREVFVRDGKRFVYLPLKAGNQNSSLIEKQFKDLLGDIPFSVEYYGIGRPLHLFFIAYVSASVCLLVIFLLRRKYNPGTANIITLMPVLSSLAFFGASGIAAAALLFAFFIMFKEPLGDFVTLTASLPKENSNKVKLIQKEIILPYKFYWFFLPVFVLSFTGIIVFSQLKLLFLLAVFACALAVFFLSLKILSLPSGDKHRRFTPILIIKRRFPEFAFSFYILPFAAAAFLTLFFTPQMPGAYVSNSKFDALIEEQDYLAHLSYQASFSTRQFGASSSDFPDFFIDTDGLPSMRGNNSANQAVNIDNFPPFPLKNLMDFFHNVNSGKRTDAGSGGSTRLTELLSLFVLLFFILPGFFIKTKGDSSKIDFSGLKAFSSKLRSKGINRNKTLVYNNKNPLRLRKDA
jgi:hypothetical protein